MVMDGGSLRKILGNSFGSEKKSYWRGTHRTRDPQQTLNWISPYLSDMGITRVANITGLDCIGVPVTMVTRPNARALSVSQGKGLSLVSAQVSGIMESVESFHAERIVHPLVLAPEILLSATKRVVDTSRLPRSRTQTYHKHVRLLWIESQDLISGEAVWLPFESVHTDFTVPLPTGSGYFQSSSNGLAAGNNHVEAVSHALCEVVERDAIALWNQRGRFDQNVVDLDSIEDGDINDLLGKLRSANLDVRIWDATSDTDIACLNCLLVGQDDGSADPEFGHGCHPNRTIALLRAVTEAVQARTTFIAGSREDFGPTDYTDEARADRLEACQGLVAKKANMVDFASLPSRNFDTMIEDVEWILGRLLAIGIEEVLWVDLTLPEFLIPVARMVVPGLEGHYKSAGSSYLPGLRAQRVLEQ